MRRLHSENDPRQYKRLPADKPIATPAEAHEVIKLWQSYIETTIHLNRLENSTQKRVELNTVLRKIEQQSSLLLDYQDAQGAQNTQVRSLAALALGYIGTPSAAKTLMAHLANPRLPELLGGSIAEALALNYHLQVDAALEAAVIDLFKRGGPRRQYALALMGSLGNTLHHREKNQFVVVTLLYGALDDKNPEARGYAAQSTGRLGPPDAAHYLIARLQRSVEEDDWVLRRLIDALGRVGTLSALPILEPYLRDEKQRTRQRARQAIRRIRQRLEFGE